MQKNCFLPILLLILPVHNVIAETAEEKGLAIAVEADKRDAGWVDQTADLEMILTNKHGDSSHRTMRLRSLEVDGDGDKSLTIFDKPRDIKGTAFLSHTHALKPDDQWLYLPALKRIKRISSANKSGPFVGSEFAYEDLSSQEVEKYTYKWLRDEVIDGHNVFVIERFPQYKNSGYTRQISWLDKEMYQRRKVEFYDRKNTLLKTLISSDYEQYLDQYWRPGKMEMVNHQTGKRTDLIWEDYQYKNGLGDRDFDRNTLKRAR
jgi:outer membrane lipoprotein-sorting protein